MSSVVASFEKPDAVRPRDNPAGRYGLRVAVVHDWLISYAGAERVLCEILAIFPNADLYALIDFLSPEDRMKLGGKRAKTSFIQNLPFARTKYRALLLLMPLAIEQFDFSAYDLVVSSSHAIAKGILVGPDQTHVCYCHTPIRYAWDFQNRYLMETKLIRGVRSALTRILLHYMRIWDSRTANGVDYFIANSRYIGRRIRKIYRRDSIVIHPPVDTESFVLNPFKENFYLAVSRFVSYKRIDLIVAAFANMPERRLVVIGDGPEMAKIKRLAGSNVTILGFQQDAVLLEYLQRARAFIFAAEEDFGILPVEAQACGTPVIAFGKGGALETVVDIRDATNLLPTGVFFYEQSKESLIDAIERFEEEIFSPGACRAWAEGFSKAVFRKAFCDYINTEVLADRDQAWVGRGMR